MNEKTKVYIMYASAIVAVLSFGYICWRIGCLHNNGAGVGNIGNQLGQAQSAAQSVTDSVSTAQTTAGEIGQTSQELGATINSIQGTLYSTGDSIADCERILEAVRSRGKIKAPAN